MTTVAEVKRAFKTAAPDKGVLLRVRAPHGGATSVLLEAPALADGGG